MSTRLSLSLITFSQSQCFRKFESLCPFPTLHHQAKILFRQYRIHQVIPGVVALPPTGAFFQLARSSPDHTLEKYGKISFRCKHNWREKAFQRGRYQRYNLQMFFSNLNLSFPGSYQDWIQKKYLLRFYHEDHWKYKIIDSLVIISEFESAMFNECWVTRFIQLVPF